MVPRMIEIWREACDDLDKGGCWCLDTQIAPISYVLHPLKRQNTEGVNGVPKQLAQNMNNINLTLLKLRKRQADKATKSGEKCRSFRRHNQCGEGESSDKRSRGRYNS